MTNPDRSELFTPDELAVRLDEWANCLDKAQFDLRSDLRCAAIHLRRLASSDGVVKVRELEWGPGTTGSHYGALSVFGDYSVWTYHDAGKWFWQNSRRDYGQADTLEAAKAAAQADYECRILSALEAPAAGDGEPVAWQVLIKLQWITLPSDWTLDEAVHGQTYRPLYTAPPAPSVAVKAKALTWRDHRPDSFPEPAWSAQTPFGFYNIEEVSASDSPAYVVRLHAHHFIADKDSLEEAKAAAQSDYEKRVRSCIPTTPEDDSVARVLSELRDRRLLNDVDDGLHEEIAESLIKAVRG